MRVNEPDYGKDFKLSGGSSTMSYTFSDSTTHRFTQDKADDYCKDNNVKVVQRVSGYPEFCYYQMSDGRTILRTRLGMELYCKINNVYKIFGGTMPVGTSGSQRYWGYNPALGCETKGERHHNQLLKERGLVEVGNDPCNHLSDRVDRGVTMTDAEIKEAVDMGASISSQEVDALKKGEKLHVD